MDLSDEDRHADQLGFGKSEADLTAHEDIRSEALRFDRYAGQSFAIRNPRIDDDRKRRRIEIARALRKDDGGASALGKRDAGGKIVCRMEKRIFFAAQRLAAAPVIGRFDEQRAHAVAGEAGLLDGNRCVIDGRERLDRVRREGEDAADTVVNHVKGVSAIPQTCPLASIDWSKLSFRADKTIVRGDRDRWPDRAECCDAQGGQPLTSEIFSGVFRRQKAGLMSVRGLERPLGLGEILDRAVTLSVQQFPMLLGVVAVVSLPRAILQSFGFNPLTQYIAAVQAGSHGGGRDMNKILASIPLARPYDYAIIGITLFFSPLLAGAMTVAVARSLDGERLSIASSYLPALRRWASLLGSFLVWILIGASAIIVLSLVFGLGALLVIRATGATATSASGTGAILLIGLVALVIAIPLFALGYALYIVSFASVVLETPNPFVAVGRAFARIFARREFLRAMVVSFALIAITFAAALFGALLGGLAFAVTKWFASYIIVVQLVNSVGIIFATAAATIYYFDVRLRREGGDLLSVPTPPASLA